MDLEAKPVRRKASRYEVFLREDRSYQLQGRVQDEAFVRYLERLADEGQRGLTLEDLVALDAIRRGERVTAPLTARLPGLLALGAIEQTGRQRYMLARRFYLLAQRPGEYTRRRGLGREAQKAILVQHVQGRGAHGAAFEELAQVLPAASRNELKVLLRSLRDAGRIHVRGSRRTALWHAGPSQVPK